MNNRPPKFTIISIAIGLVGLVLVGLFTWMVLQNNIQDREKECERTVSVRNDNRAMWVYVLDTLPPKVGGNVTVTGGGTRPVSGNTNGKVSVPGDGGPGTLAPGTRMPDGSVVGGGTAPTTSGGDYGGYVPAGMPGPVGVGQYLKTVTASGYTFTVNKYAAPKFVGLVNALVKRGYKPVSIGGYSNRNQANGSGLKSLHAYGLAIDIDPSVNPFTSGPAPHKMPDWAGALAAKYGLVWGGTWKNSKDYMHFSLPYGGRM